SAMNTSLHTQNSPTLFVRISNEHNTQNSPTLISNEHNTQNSPTLFVRISNEHKLGVHRTLQHCLLESAMKHS
ncbi:hypothetical protein L9F63_019682, partial [Diploptera punctata]